ncbi:MaoC family dehydratase [uncultured Sphingomonas sp.]|uniref:MaoC family dehydratase n=1 Tax=uncultured Sphingomonas sp. TaxID=158754 RepID=UPI0035CBC45D
MRQFENAAAFAATMGEPHGPSDWVTVTQSMIDDFAKATGDRQWIHVDVERAAREAPGGTTIAHGYLTLSLLGTLMPLVFDVRAARIINVGSNRLRFLAPVPVGARLRLTMTAREAEPTSGGLKITCEAQFEIEGAKKPALIADLIILYID